MKQPIRITITGKETDYDKLKKIIQIAEYLQLDIKRSATFKRSEKAHIKMLIKSILKCSPIPPFKPAVRRSIGERVGLKN